MRFLINKEQIIAIQDILIGHLVLRQSWTTFVTGHSCNLDLKPKTPCCMIRKVTLDLGKTLLG